MPLYDVFTPTSSLPPNLQFMVESPVMIHRWVSNILLPLLLLSNSLLRSFFRMFQNTLHGFCLVLRHIFCFSRHWRALQWLPIDDDSRDLGGADAKKKEVDSGEEDVFGLNDHAPSGPDSASCHECEVLLEREGFNGSEEVWYTGKDDSPLFSSC